MSRSNRPNFGDIRGSELNRPLATGTKDLGTTYSALSATSLTLESGVLVYNHAVQALVVTHTGPSGVSDGDTSNSQAQIRKGFKLNPGEQVFIECDNLIDVLVGQTTLLTGANDEFSFEAH